MSQWISDGLLALMEALWNWISAFFIQVWNIAKLPAEAMLTALRSTLTTQQGEAPFWSYLDTANMYVDVVGILTILLNYLLFLSAWITYRIVKSWIPTVSGS